MVPINTEGEIFDPTKHEVLAVEKSNESENIPDNTILEELEKGYCFKDKLLRPSKVKIAKACE